MNKELTNMIEEIGEEKVTKTLRSLLTFEEQVKCTHKDEDMNEYTFTRNLKSIMCFGIDYYYELLSDKNKHNFYKGCVDENIKMMTEHDLHKYHNKVLRNLKKESA